MEQSVGSFLRMGVLGTVLALGLLLLPPPMGQTGEARALLPRERVHQGGLSFWDHTAKARYREILASLRRADKMQRPLPYCLFPCLASN